MALSELIFKQFVVILFSLFYIIPSHSAAQGEECDEVLVSLQVDHIGRTELSSFIPPCQRKTASRNLPEYF